MITLIQRVKNASVSVDDKTISDIGSGLLLYLGLEDGDNLEKINWCINKIINLRIFPDSDGKMNLSLLDIKGSLLVISNFTLPADLTESGRRPSFTRSLKPELAEGLYNQFIEECKKLNINTASGIFGADMKVSSINDGPINFILKR